jgi:hypothetical protein
VLASITGDPKPGSSIKVNEVGSVDLLNPQVELRGAGQARFNNLSIPATTRNQLTSQDYRVNVNVFSGRKSSQDNVLSCDIFDGRISAIQPGVTLKCGLIGEYDGQAIGSVNQPTTETQIPSGNPVPALW